MLFGKVDFVLSLFFLTFIGLPIGGLFGYCGGRIAREFLKPSQHHPILNLCDIPIGFIGLLCGVAFAMWAGRPSRAPVIAAFISAVLVVFLWNAVVKVVSSALPQTFVLPSSLKWRLTHLLVQAAAWCNTALLIFEVTRSPHHHTWINFVYFVALWLCVSIIGLPTVVLVEQWWVRKSKTTGQQWAIIADGVASVAWAIVFVMLLERASNL